MNSSFPNMPTLLRTETDRQRPFAWINELSAFLSRNWRIMAVSIGVMMVLSLIYLMTSMPGFTASATLFIDERQSELLQQHATTADAQIENARIESEVEVLRSAGLARKVVSRLDLGADPVFTRSTSLLSHLTAWLPSSHGSPAASPYAREDRLVMHFLQMVSRHRIGVTYGIEIDATAPSPVLAARLANGLAEAYVAEQSDVKGNAARQAGTWWQDKLLELQDQALRADQAAQLFKSRNNIVDTGHGFLNEQQLVEINTRLVAARGRTAEAVARLDRVRQMTGSQHDGDVGTSDMLQSPVITGLREKYLTDARHVAEWSARYGRDHGAAVLLRREMVQLKASIGSEIRRIEAATESDVQVDRADEAAIQAQLDAVVRQSDATEKARTTLRSLQSSADTYRSLYVAFLQRTMQVAQDQSFPVADARIVTEARPPLTKSKPQGKLILVGAALVGTAIGFVLSLLREAVDRRIRSGADLAEQTGVACLVSLPAIGMSPAWTPWSRSRADHRPDASVPVVSPGDHGIEHPDGEFGRGIRRLQLRLQQRAIAGTGRRIGLISPTPGAGTTTVASNLVQSLKRSGHDAVLLTLGDLSESRERIQARIDLLRKAHDAVVVDFPSLSQACEAHAIFPDIEDMVLVVDADRLDGAGLLERLRDGGLDRRGLSGAVLNNVRDRIRT